MMKRIAQPKLSAIGELGFTRYEQRLRVEENLSAVTIQNYLSDLRLFATWCEAGWQQVREDTTSFTLEAVTTPRLIEYRTYLQQVLQFKTASVNRSLVSLKRYFTWLVAVGHLAHDPGKVVKFVGEEVISPGYLDDREEQALVAAVTKGGSARDQAIIVLMLHTGLHAREVCMLTRAHVRLGKRNGIIVVHGKRNKYREVPLDATVRHVRGTKNDLQRAVENIAWV